MEEESARTHEQHRRFADIVERSLLQGILVPGDIVADPKAHQDWQLYLENLRAGKDGTNGDGKV